MCSDQHVVGSDRRTRSLKSCVDSAGLCGSCLVEWQHISEGRQFMLFVGRDSDERLPLTRRALEALLANGLITALEDDNVVQRAVDTLMSDLDGG